MKDKSGQMSVFAFLTKKCLNRSIRSVLHPLQADKEKDRYIIYIIVFLIRLQIL